MKQPLQLVPLITSLLAKDVNAFSSVRSPTFATSSAFSSTRLHYSNTPNSDETPEQTAHRMELVRHIQNSFYQPSYAPKGNEEESTTFMSSNDHNTTLLYNLPLFRAPWVEFPGLQKVVEVNEPHYTHMFHTILHSAMKCQDKDKRQKYYFGHLYLPGGSDNLDNVDYALDPTNDKASQTGVLMEISDWIQNEENGHWTLIVQAVEKFQIRQTIRWHSPYAIAHVELCPDAEFMGSFIGGGNRTQRAEAVQHVLELHNYEVRPVRFEECVTTIDSGRSLNKIDASALSLSPLCQYNHDHDPVDPSSNSTQNPNVLERLYEMEHRVWVKLDEMIRLLQSAVGGQKAAEVPIPIPLLALLPIASSHVPWPKEFLLERTARKLETEEEENATLRSSSFVRVDTNDQYSSQRRLSRLSYVIWTLVDSIVLAEMEEGKEGLGRQGILEMDSTAQRLRLAESKLDVLCSMLQKMLQ